jgi:hypothetical protein
VDWHFLTIGLGAKNYERAASRLAKEAARSRSFKSVIIENNKTLASQHAGFISEHSDFIIQYSKEGFGNYLWKPYLINHWLNNVPDGDGILFLDAGCTINLSNLSAKSRWDNYFSLAKIRGSLVTQLNNGEFGIDNLTEEAWTTPELIHEIGLSDVDAKSNQIQSGIIFLAKNELNLFVLNEWWKLSTLNDYSFLKTKQFNSEFGISRTNRWEQSIFSCLVKKHKLYSIPDETYFYPDWHKKGKKFPIWAIRNRSGVSVVRFSVKDIPTHTYRLSKRVIRKLSS